MLHRSRVQSLQVKEKKRKERSHVGEIEKIRKLDEDVRKEEGSEEATVSGGGRLQSLLRTLIIKEQFTENISQILSNT